VFNVTFHPAAMREMPGCLEVKSLAAIRGIRNYAGQTVDIIDRHTGEVRHAQIFVAVLGCSNYTFAEATWTQTLPDWLGSHVRALQFFDGTPAAIVPDNLKSGVVKARRYEPDLNPAYQDFAEHYGMAILPARVRKPRDKAKVEGAVLIVERWILARLRHHTFFSLGQLNVEIERLMRDFNTRPFQKLDGCRQSRFDELERPALKPLPSRTYTFAQWKHAKVHPDYHIEVERAYYSVPYKLIGQRVDVRLTETMLEVFHQGQLVAAHARAHRKGEFVTVAAHRPDSHQAVIERSHARLLERASAIGPATAELIRMQARMKRHPEQTLRSSQGIVRLAADFSPSQLEAACARLGTAPLQLSCHSCPHHRGAADTGVCSETPRASHCAGSRLLPITRPLINR
jgi:transposase